MFQIILYMLAPYHFLLVDNRWCRSSARDVRDLGLDDNGPVVKLDECCIHHLRRQFGQQLSMSLVKLMEITFLSAISWRYKTEIWREIENKSVAYSLSLETNLRLIGSHLVTVMCCDHLLIRLPEGYSPIRQPCLCTPSITLSPLICLPWVH